MKVSVDTRFRLKALALFGLEFYKIIMGTMLTIFVPTVCDTSLCTPGQVVSRFVGEENWPMRFAVGMNFATLVCVVVLYGFELYRENWIIEHLDVDPDKPNNHLDGEIEGYPEFKETMHKLNVDYCRTSSSTFWLVVINFTLSSVYIYSGHSAGTQTLVSLLSYLLLVMLKLYTTKSNARASIDEERAYSAYMTVHKTFNTIDEDHRIPHAAPPPSAPPPSAPDQIEIEIAIGKT